MTAPTQAGLRFLVGLALGAGLGLFYGFLRPLRQKRTAPADLLFIAVAFWVWIYHSFAVCAGDIRFGGSLSLGLGAVLWELSAGWLLRPVFCFFWKIIGKGIDLLTLPIRKIFYFSCVFLKKVFAYMKKKGTIYWSNRRK